MKTSSKKLGAKLPSLHPRQLHWGGERAKLRPFIQRWYNHLSGFQDYPALMFLVRCVPLNYKNTILSSTTLVSCLKKMARHCANEEMYCLKAVKFMKAQRGCRNFQDDKKMLNLFENKLVDIISVNPTKHLDFLTVKQLLHKLLSETI